MNVLTTGDVSANKNGATNQGPHQSRNGGEYFRALIEFTADAIISIDTRGTIELFNKAAENLFGYSHTEIVGRNIKILMPTPHQDQHDEYLAAYMKTGKANILGRWREVEGLRKDGVKVPIEIGIREFWVEGKQIFTGSVRDLTEIKRTEEELRRKAKDILELSTPALAVWNGVLLLPLIGTLDSYRIKQCTELALNRMREENAHVMIIDITGVPVMDTMVANHLMSLASSVRLMGGQCVLTGISPATAITIVNLGVNLIQLDTRGSLQEGLKLAMAMVEKQRQIK